MKLKSTLFLAVPLLFLGLSLAQAQVSIQLVRTFHYTYENNGFFPGHINDSDILVGSIITTDGDAEAFYGRVDGRFSAPFHVPADTVGFTTASGINNHRVICGRYDGSDLTTKGYVRIGDNYFTYVVPLGPSVTSTTVDSINDANNFVGGYILNGSTVGVYANLGGVFTKLSSVPGEVPEAHGINRGLSNSSKVFC